MTLKRGHRHAGYVPPERPCRDTDSANASERGLSFCIRNWVGPASDAKPGLAYTWGLGGRGCILWRIPGTLASKCQQYRLVSI